jgi:1-phosphofructokinase
VVRSTQRWVDPGGKGINVARALAANGHDALAVVPVGGAEGGHLAQLLVARRIVHRVVPIAGAIRCNVTVVEPDGTTTKLNEPGPTLSGDEAESVLAATALAVSGSSADWLVTGGSLFAGAPADFHGRVVEAGHRHGAKVAVDTSGISLERALAAGPDLVKPNRDELAEAVGRPLASLGDVVGAAHELRARGAVAVLASLGEHGAIYVDGIRELHATSSPVPTASTVGAGDCTLAGFLTGGTPDARLATAVAWGAAAVQLPGTTVPGPDDVVRDTVLVTDVIDLRTPLGDQQLPDHGARTRVG